MSGFVLAIDQGTTSSRVIIFNRKAKPIHQHQLEFTQHFPQNGWIEHDDPKEIWETTITYCRKALADASMHPVDIAAIGISNQRETTILWDRNTGQPIYRAIVWQDRRTMDDCQQLALQKGFGSKLVEKTGLALDPYFSFSRIKWLLNNKAKRGELAFGTVDTYLLWKLTGGKQHATNATNPARTGLFNITTQRMG